MITTARFNLALWGFLVGLYAFAFVFGSVALAVLLLFAVLLIIFILKHREDTREDLTFLLGGILLAVVLCLLFPAFSLMTLSTELLIISVGLVLLIVKN